MIDNIKKYLNRKLPYLYSFAIRKGLSIINSSNRVEKLNDLIVSWRCKGKGMSWSKLGLKGIRNFRLLIYNKDTSFFVNKKVSFI